MFLLEPSMNPALESQAIGRVHRLGQKRKVQVTRLLMKDSIETRLRSLITKKFGGVKKEGGGASAPVAATTSDDPMIAAASKAPAGSLASDKATLLAQEFDFLLGVEMANDADADPNQVATAAMVPDQVDSAFASAAKNDDDNNGH